MGYVTIDGKGQEEHSKPLKTTNGFRNEHVLWYNFLWQAKLDNIVPMQYVNIL